MTQELQIERDKNRVLTEQVRVFDDILLSLFFQILDVPRFSVVLSWNLT